MTSWTATSANPCRRFLRAVLAHAMALAVLITLVIPHHSTSCGPILDASSPAITASIDDVGGPSGDPADLGLVQARELRELPLPHGRLVVCAHRSGVDRHPGRAPSRP